MYYVFLFSSYITWEYKMRFHYLKDNKPICGKSVDMRYTTDDWSMVDCIYCLSHKDKPQNGIKKISKGKYA